jgi:putative membrane protein
MIIIPAIFVGLAVLLLIALYDPAVFGLSPPPRYGLFGGFFGFFLLILCAFFIVRVLFWSSRASRYPRRYRSGPGGAYGPNRPMQVARMRYARGEITREQFEQIAQDLGRRPGPP